MLMNGVQRYVFMHVHIGVKKAACMGLLERAPSSKVESKILCGT